MARDSIFRIASITKPIVAATVMMLVEDGLLALDDPVGEWMAALAPIPLLHQPGEAWLYNTCSDLQGVLVARASGTPLPEFLAERPFEPLGMADAAFWVEPGKLDRFTSTTGPVRREGWSSPDAPDGVPSAGSVAILLTQIAAAGPTPPEPMRDLWRHAAGG